MDEKRYAEAEVIARQANDIAPNEAVVVNMVEKSKLAHRIYEDLRDSGSARSADSADQMLNIGESADCRSTIAIRLSLAMSRRGRISPERAAAG